NLGHTFGHAFESMAMERGTPLSHGYAVAFGMVAALILSHLELDFPTEWLNRYVTFVKENYGGFAFDCRDTDRLVELMLHDKKNTTAGSINFTLLRNVGQVEVNRPASRSNIRAALEIYRDMVL
ncbi:MAG: 3-dehydroquinate synthase, partial [Muribaculaceae bacterium]|nr:3-dehydroquinate synthase [Muribaculaceae bacterium]